MSIEQTKNWIASGDKWILTYVIVCDHSMNNFPSGLDLEPGLFCLAHALELYMKGCLSCISHDSSLLSSHNLFDIWVELKKDSRFIPGIEIKGICNIKKKSKEYKDIPDY